MYGFRRFRIVPVLLVAALVPMLTLSACGSSSSKTTAAASKTTAAAGNTITISNFDFSPKTLNVKVGDTITVTNKDDAPHSVTAKDHSFDTGTFTKGKTATFTVTKAGTFPYYCSVHQYMTGVIQVSP